MEDSFRSSQPEGPRVTVVLPSKECNGELSGSWLIGEFPGNHWRTLTEDEAKANPELRPFFPTDHGIEIRQHAVFELVSNPRDEL
jgi:hypothetical protein